MPLITVAELEDRLQRTVDADAGLQAVELASAMITGYTGQDIARATHTDLLDVTLRQLPRVDLPEGHPLENFGHTVGVVHLPQRPVVSVTSVVADLVTVPTAEWYFDAFEQVVMLEEHDQWRVQVTYVAGYDPIPDDIKAVALAIASAELTNPLNVESERVGDYAVTYAANAAATGGSTLPPLQQRILDKYRKRVGSIRQR